MSEGERTVDRKRMVGGRNVIGRRWMIWMGDERREQGHEKRGEKKERALHEAKVSQTAAAEDPQHWANWKATVWNRCRYFENYAMKMTEYSGI
jgi:hypothetical protein